MTTFNALVAVEVADTHIDRNLPLKLEQLLKPYKEEGRFDWYAIGIHNRIFDAYFDPVCGWVDHDESDGFVDWEDQLDTWITGLSPRFALVPLRCHRHTRA